MRRVKVDLSEIADAMDNSSPEMIYYLDLETGEVVLVQEEFREELEEIYEEMYGDGDEPRMSLDDALAARNVPEWQKESIRAAHLVEEGYGTRLIEIPQRESRDGYGDMEAFIETVSDRRLQDRLRRAINGRGAFRHFKDTLLDYPKERERWFAFEQERMRQRVLEWLADEEIEPITE